jgi:signal peptidase I
MHMSNMRTYLIISLLIALVVGLTMLSNTSQATKIGSIPSSIITAEYSGMTPYIQFTGHQLVIINKNDFDWTNVRVKLVSGAGTPWTEPDRGDEVVMTLPRLRARSTFTVAASEWGDDRPGRAQPGISKPSQLTIHCETPYGTCAWSGRWQ